MFLEDLINNLSVKNAWNIIYAVIDVPKEENGSPHDFFCIKHLTTRPTIVIRYTIPEIMKVVALPKFIKEINKKGNVKLGNHKVLSKDRISLKLTFIKALRGST